LTQTPTAEAPAGWRSLVQGDNAGRFLIIAGGVSLHAVSIYVVATIMPVVVRDIGGLDFFTWTTTLYVAGSLTGSAAVPLLLSRLGPRRAYRAAFALFIAGSLICAVAPSMAVLLVGRVLQGTGGGMLPALAYTTVRSIFPPAMHARAIAMLGSVWGIAALLGPLVGGVFAQLDNWRAAFGIDLVIGLAFAIVAGRVLPLHAAGTAPRPFPGLRLALLAAAALCVSAGGVTGHALPALLGILAAALLVFATLRIDGQATVRLLPTGAFNPTTPTGAVSCTIGLMILANSPGTFIPYLLHASNGVAPIIGGYVYAIMALSWTFASLLTASVTRRQSRAVILAGPFVMALGLACDAWALGHGSLPGVMLGQLLLGLGIGVGWAHLVALQMEVAPVHQKDVAGPFVTITQTLAAAFGSAIAGMVANLANLPAATTPQTVATAALWLFTPLIIVPLTAALTAWRTLRLTPERVEVD